MSPTYDFYDARADEAEAAAGRAMLDNVRDRELRSAAVFRKLADQARSLVVDRAKAEVIRVERRAAEAETAARALAARSNDTPPFGAAGQDPPILRHSS